MSALETCARAANYREKSGHVAPPELIAPYYPAILSGFPRDMVMGIHGPAHWQRVEANARRLAPLVGGVDLELCVYFSWLHDCRRRDDLSDLSHSDRGADFAREILSGVLSSDRMDALWRMLALHTLGMSTGEPTEAVAWDADRLELLRFRQKGMLDPMRFSTPAGRALCAA